MQREESIKFLGVLLDEHLTWEEHIKLTENKIAKSIGILYKARTYLDKRALLCLCSTNRTYLKKLQSLNKSTLLELSFTKKIIY